MTKRPLILLDCDGVLADFVGGVLETVEEVTGLSYEHEDVDHFDFCEALGIRGDDARVIKRAIATPGFCDRLAVYDGAKAGVRALQEIADVRIVTTPWDSSPTWVYERESWLWRHFKIPAKHVTHTREKHRLAGDVFVDDKTTSVAAWSEAWPGRLAIRWNTPHNASDAWGGETCQGWDRLLGLVRAIVKLDSEIHAGPGCL